MNSANDTNLAIFPQMNIYYSVFLFLGLVLVAFSAKLLSDTILKRNSLNDREVKKNVLIAIILLVLGISSIAPTIARLLEKAFFALF